MADYERVCHEHGLPLLWTDDDDIVCPEGHTLSALDHWDVVQTNTGLVVGKANAQSGGNLLIGSHEEGAEAPPEYIPRKPLGACKRGHYGPWILKPNKRWRCTRCQEIDLKKKMVRKELLLKQLSDLNKQLEKK